MIPCRVVFSELPPELVDRVMRVDEVGDGDSEWQLLRSGNTRKTYKFSSKDSDESWVVKWGCNYKSLRQIKPALRGRDEATVEYEKTEKAAGCGIPVLRFSFLAAPKLSSLSIRTLLVSRFIENAVNIIEFIDEHYWDKDLVQDLLIQLGRGVAGIHKNELLHRDLSLDNILVVPEGDGHKIIFIDWFKMHVAKGKDDFIGFRQDLVAPLSDFIYIGLSERRIRPFLEAYSKEMPWFEKDIDAMLARGRKTRIGVCKRAFKNCIRRSRRLIQYRWKGHRVFQFKAAKVDPDRHFTENGAQRHKGFVFGDDSRLLADWRCANVLKMTGCLGHDLGAYGKKARFPFLSEILVSVKDPESIPVADVLSGNNTGISRKELLYNAGDFLRRLNYLNMGLKNIEISNWYCVPSVGDRLQFSTKDLSEYVLFQANDSGSQFAWMKSLQKNMLTTKDLLYFLKGYGDGTIDKKLKDLGKGIFNIDRQDRLISVCSERPLSGPPPFQGGVRGGP